MASLWPLLWPRSMMVTSVCLSGLTDGLSATFACVGPLTFIRMLYSNALRRVTSLIGFSRASRRASSRLAAFGMPATMCAACAFTVSSRLRTDSALPNHHEAMLRHMYSRTSARQNARSFSLSVPYSVVATALTRMSRVSAAAFTLSACLLSPLCGCMVRPSSLGARTSFRTVSPTFGLKRFVSLAPNSVCSVFTADTSMRHSADHGVMQSNPCCLCCLISLGSAVGRAMVRSSAMNPCCRPGMQFISIVHWTHRDNEQHKSQNRALRGTAGEAGILRHHIVQPNLRLALLRKAQGPRHQVPLNAKGEKNLGSAAVTN
ncbi:hypothetical protein, conserved in T. vivax [Trypanosoma vivax Y486]|uniref:Uncharacterized protein n=1 Tax=Trypanosoma vivax (strain Y486) TaxID=1055687 RepID=F9WRU9_TRYVY|nr:hypothetical protein, conserved in T. vivax [Trypanosoma vivax Y486]|eukprot:CCD20284.1 hypothetical protein, conserved in T. vivax [Trypanosoma vivax Y486]